MNTNNSFNQKLILLSSYFCDKNFFSIKEEILKTDKEIKYINFFVSFKNISKEFYVNQTNKIFDRDLNINPFDVEKDLYYYLPFSYGLIFEKKILGYEKKNCFLIERMIGLDNEFFYCLFEINEIKKTVSNIENSDEQTFFKNLLSVKTENKECFFDFAKKNLFDNKLSNTNVKNTILNFVQNLNDIDVLKGVEELILSSKGIFAGEFIKLYE